MAVSTRPFAIALALGLGVWPVAGRYLALAKAPAPYRVPIDPGVYSVRHLFKFAPTKESFSVVDGYLSSFGDRGKALFG